MFKHPVKHLKEYNTVKLQILAYHEVGNSRLSRLVAHLRIIRLFIKGKFDAYVL